MGSKTETRKPADAGDASDATSAARQAAASDPAFPNLSDVDIDRIAARIVEKSALLQPAPADSSWPPGTKASVRRVTAGEFIYAGRRLDRNQVFELTGQRLDARLGPLGYIERVHPKQALETCGTCGGQFIDSASAAAHYDKRHAAKPERAIQMEGRRAGETHQEFELRELAFRQSLVAQEEAREAQDETRENMRAPLHLDQTRASRV